MTIMHLILIAVSASFSIFSADMPDAVSLQQAKEDEQHTASSDLAIPTVTKQRRRDEGVRWYVENKKAILAAHLKETNSDPLKPKFIAVKPTDDEFKALLRAGKQHLLPQPKSSAELDALLKFAESDSRSWYFNGKSSLILATQFEDLNLVSELLTEGVNPLQPLMRSPCKGIKIRGTAAGHPRAKHVVSAPQDTPRLRKKASVNWAPFRRKSAPFDHGIDQSTCASTPRVVDKRTRFNEPVENSIALHFAACLNNAEIVKQLLYGSEPDEQVVKPRRQKSIMQFKPSGNRFAVEQIIKRDDNGNTAIHLAVLNNSYEALEALFKSDRYERAVCQVLNFDGGEASNVRMNELPIILAIYKILESDKSNREEQIEISYKIIKLLLQHGARTDVVMRGDHMKLPEFVQDKKIDKILALFVPPKTTCQNVDPDFCTLQEILCAPSEEFIAFLDGVAPTATMKEIHKGYKKRMEAKQKDEKKKRKNES